MTVRPVLALFLLTYTGFAQQMGRVEGRVLTPSGEPIGKATVRLTTGQPPQRSVYVEVTSSNGRFTVANVAPGRYTASAQRPGFIAARNSSGATVPIPVDVVAGATKTSVDLLLTPLAALSGTITDADGDPAPGSQVSLMRYTFAQGRTVLINSSSGITDDRGIFRFPNTQPGRYYLLASPRILPRVAGEIRGRSALQGSLPTYYPNSADARGAVAITVDSTEVSNLNIRLRSGGTFSIAGSLMGTGGTPVAGTITVIPKGGIAPLQGIETQMSPQAFLVNGLAAGEYTLLVRSNSAPVLSGRVDVTVGSSDLQNVIIRMTPGAAITGRVTIDGGGDLTTFMSSLPAIPLSRVSAPGGTLTPTGAQIRRTPSVTLASVEGPSTVTGQVGQDGTFSIQNIPPLKRILQIGQLPPTAYLKAVRFGGQDVTRSFVDLSSGQGGMLEILIGTKGVEITAVPRNSNGETPQEGAAVAVWPRIPNLGSASGDVRFASPTTSFKAQGLPPGEYFVAALDAPSDTTFADLLKSPEFLARFASAATRVTVKEGESAAVEPKIISRDAVQAALAQFP